MKRTMTRLMALALISGFAGLAAGCRTAPLSSEAASVRIHFQEGDLRDCAYLGEVVGSAGHWYNSWLIANDVLMNGALNDLRNKAQAKGADSLVVSGHPLYFQTSVTLLGQAYRCRK